VETRVTDCVVLNACTISRVQSLPCAILCDLYGLAANLIGVYNLSNSDITLWVLRKTWVHIVSSQAKYVDTSRKHQLLTIMDFRVSPSSSLCKEGEFMKYSITARAEPRYLLLDAYSDKHDQHEEIIYYKGLPRPPRPPDVYSLCRSRYVT
jgi:hypothetical protein